jgi:ATP-dependent helicase STH1/SNF2
LDSPTEPFIEDDTNSGIYPFNTFVHPLTHLKRPDNVLPALWQSRLQRLLVPAVMPVGPPPSHCRTELVH